MIKRCKMVLVAAPMAVGLLALAGCGTEERMETGTQVQVTSDMEREALAADKFLTEESKAKKSQPRKAMDAVEPGAP